MKTKLMACFFAMVMLFAFSTVAMADSIAVGDQVYLSTIVGNQTLGGPFLVKSSLTDAVLFTTFCLERNESQWPAPLTVSSISNVAELGGIGGGSPDPLDERTAYLYSAYRSGVSFDLNALQVAIWLIEDETDDSGTGLYSTAAYPELSFLSLAKDYRTLAANAVAAGWLNNNQVMVVNPNHPDGTPAQSFVAYVPEPMSLLLLGFGLLGLGITRRKLKK